MFMFAETRHLTVPVPTWGDKCFSELERFGICSFNGAKKEQRFLPDLQNAETQELVLKLLFSEEFKNFTSGLTELINGMMENMKVGQNDEQN